MKNMASTAQLFAQFGVVVDFAIEREHSITVLALEWLVAAVEIYDPQANGAKRERLGLVEPLLVGSTMRKGECSSPDASALNPTLIVCKSSYPAQIPAIPTPAPNSTARHLLISLQLTRLQW